MKYQEVNGQDLKLSCKKLMMCPKKEDDAFDKITSVVNFRVGL